MQRATSVLLGLLLATAIVVVVLRAGRARPVGEPSAPDGGTAIEASDRPSEDAAADGEGGKESEPSGLADGGGLPSLPSNAPKRVGIGVILFKYRGSERAPKDARSKKRALELARSVLALAKEDFEEAAKKGDRGSRAELGRVPRGILEPKIESVLFRMKKGDVYEQPLDTPTGYWVVRRTE